MCRFPIGPSLGVLHLWIRVRPTADTPKHRPALRPLLNSGFCSAVIELSEFVFETVHEDGELALSRGRSEREPSAILALAAVSELPAVGTLDRLEHEYSLREVLDSNWAARPLALSRLQGRMALVLQDPGGAPLQRLVGQPMELNRFLRFAIGLATAVGKLHELGFARRS